jgi:hypothetical protein
MWPVGGVDLQRRICDVRMQRDGGLISSRGTLGMANRMRFSNGPAIFWVDGGARQRSYQSHQRKQM